MVTNSKATETIYLCNKGLNKCGADGKEKLTQEYTASQFRRTWQLMKMGMKRRDRKLHNEAQVPKRW